MMSNRSIVWNVVAMAILCVSTLFADTLHLANGTSMSGTVVAMDAGNVSFLESGGEFHVFRVAAVKSIDFSRYFQPASATVTAELRSDTGGPSAAIPGGSVISVRLDEGISPDASKPGASFDATLDQPLLVDGRTLAPAGTKATVGVIRDVGTPGFVALVLTGLTIDGHTFGTDTGFAQPVGEFRSAEEYSPGKAAPKAVVDAALRGGSVVTTIGPNHKATFQVVRGPKLVVSPSAVFSFTLACPTRLQPYKTEAAL
jgi:hypothetical protein